MIGRTLSQTLYSAIRRGRKLMLAACWKVSHFWGYILQRQSPQCHPANAFLMKLSSQENDLPNISELWKAGMPGKFQTVLF